MRGRILHDRGGWIGSPNMPCACYWFDCLYSERDQPIKSDCFRRKERVRRGLIYPLSTAARMFASVGDGGLWASLQGAVSLIAAWCWKDITFI